MSKDAAQIRHINSNNGSIKLQSITQRRYSCEDIGRGDHEGWLYYKHRSHSLFNHWVRRWCVIKSRKFYIFKNNEKICKAETVISMPAFKVNQASFVKSKSFAFRIYNGGTEFLLSAESEQDLKRWIHDAENASMSIHERSEEFPEIQEYENDDLEKDPFDDPNDDFKVISRNIKDSSIAIDGSDKTRRRQTVISGLWRHNTSGEQGQRFLKLGTQLQSLQRTLKDKEMELENLETERMNILRNKLQDCPIAN